MIIEPAFDIAREIFQPAAQHVKILTEVFNCKTRYSTCRTVLDQIGAHGLNTVAWRWALPSSPTPSACRLRGLRAGLRLVSDHLILLSQASPGTPILQHRNGVGSPRELHPEAPTDPDVRISRIRLFGSRLCYVTE